MARVTVEDCVVQVPNRFELVMLAASRARALSSGAELYVERDRDKNPVVALREIAETKLDLEGLREGLIKRLQKRIEPDQPEDDASEVMVEDQQNWASAEMADMAGDDEDDELDGEEVEAAGEDTLGSVSFEDAEPQD